MGMSPALPVDGRNSMALFLAGTGNAGIGTSYIWIGQGGVPVYTGRMREHESPGKPWLRSQGHKQ
jgi:hypothetical protein